ncbi:flavin reductase like domain-containing protein [Nemania sp. FL0031]|nr:flavin reductase like domain-containing protein [Nemania sp. FL0031]
MQSIRGLRWAIASTRPRYALIYFPSRSFASSSALCSIKQSSQALEADRTATVREREQDHEGEETTEKHVSTSRENVGSNETDKPNQKARDLCNSVTAVMARLPHPAVVITTLDRTYQAQAAAGVPTEEMRHPIARGITASSFTSLCIRPKPHVMFNMTLPSTMYEALVACKDFNVHILTPDKSGARVASVFSRGNRLPPRRIRESERASYAFDIDADLGVFVGLKEKGFRHVEIANRDAWHEQYQSAKKSDPQTSESSPEVDQDEPLKQVHRVPCLHSTGIMEVLNCRLVRAIHPELPNAGQNVVIIGEVVGVTLPKQSNEKLGRAPVALGYADRKYRSVGGAIHPHEMDNLDD